MQILGMKQKPAEIRSNALNHLQQLNSLQGKLIGQNWAVWFTVHKHAIKHMHKNQEPSSTNFTACIFLPCLHISDVDDKVEITRQVDFF